MDKAEWGRSDPVLDLCGWECRGRCMYARAYRLCDKQDLNWATAWSTAAHWSLLHSRHVSPVDVLKERLDWIAYKQYSPNNSPLPFNYLCAFSMAQTFILGSAWLHHKSSWKIKPDFVRRKETISGFFLGQSHRSRWDHGINVLVARAAGWFLGRNGFLHWDSHSFGVAGSVIYHTEMRGIMQTWDLFF